MPIFIAQGRFTEASVKGMVAKPEDRAEAAGQLFAKAGSTAECRAHARSLSPCGRGSG